jgi:hypothetical protein
MIVMSKKLITHHSLFITVLTSSADEVDYLYAVAFFEAGLMPVGAANDPAVQFDCQSFGSQGELRDEFGKRD